MTIFLMTEAQHAQIVAAYTEGDWNDMEQALAMLKAMQPAPIKGWISQSGAVTNVFASNGTPHDGKLYGWSPLYTPTKD